MSQPIKLYYWPTPNGWKISIALEEMGLPYEVSLVNINKGDQYSTEFAAVAPNNKMPAIYDPDGPGGEPISIFESGAILQYLARKTGRFYGSSEREQIAVDEWLMWQMGGVGPMAGQSHHFMKYAPMMDPPQVLPYAQDRYKREVGRLYKVHDKRLSEHEWVAGDFYSIADMAIWPWAQGWDKIGQAQTMDDKPHMQRWLDACWDRPAVRKGRELRNDLRDETGKTEESQAILFKHGA